ncbi:MAG: hypothetical protein N3I86_08850 [Verrucomicrobiae bacterium]|nr:hypothetical protein [Verrucomicrobiae bacterium]
MAINDWNIQPRASACEACRRAFADKAPYHTFLFEERGELQRFDVCHNCWQTQFRDGATERKGFVSYWQGVYEAPPPPTEPIRRETAESLLRKLIEQNDPRYLPATFILAVMLERKRVLKVKEQIVRDGRRTFIYEQRETGDVFTIPDPDLKLDQLEDVQRTVAELLEHGLNPTQSSPETATPPPTATEPQPLESAPAGSAPA